MRTLAWVLLAAAGAVAGLGGFTFVYGKGYSYLLDDPVVCTNCHVMRDNFDLWAAASHRTVTCNQCHTPHGLRKYAAELRNGVVHSAVFTLRDVPVLRIKPYNQEILQGNCESCHRPMIDAIQPPGGPRARYCFDCHPGVGHGW